MPETNADTETNKNPKVDRIRKRDGRVVDFNKKKIEDAIYAAMKEAGEEDRELAEDLADQTTEKVAEKFTEKDEVPEVEDIQDQVEATLIENNLTKTAKSYILYRSRRAEIRETKKDLLPEELSVEDKLIKEMGINSLKVLEERYLLKDEDGNLKETPRGMLKRVAEDIAKAEENYGGDLEKWEQKFFEMMEDLDFLPNSPTLMNAGAPLQQLAACFVLPVEDDLEQIYDSVKNAALVHQSGGGTGFSFSRLRPKGDVVKSTNGVASGPVSFMKVFDASTEIIKQGGKRRGANMGVLRVDHPDILHFITAKSQKQELQNFNISVALTEKFMDRVEKGETYDLVNPRNNEVANRLNAEKVFDLIATLAWNSGDPGIIFLDRINEENPTPDAGEIESTNPCFTGDTRIYTSEGLRKAEELSQEGEENEIILDSRESEERVTKASNVFKTGEKHTYNLKTEEGYELKVTGNHKIKTNSGTWKEARELQPGDEIHILDREGKFPDKKELPFEVKKEFKGENGKTYEYNFPEKWSEELGQVLGWLIGDGWLRSGDENRRVGFTFSQEDKEIMESLKPVINDWYGNDIQEIERDNEVYHLSYHSKYFVDYFKKLGVKSAKSERKEVPETLYTAPKETVRGFLQALFTADGSFQGNLERGGQVRLSQSNLSLLKEVQKLLLNFGIFSKIYENRREEGKKRLPDGKGGKKEYQVKAQHDLAISKENLQKFKAEIGFISDRKQKQLEKHLNKMEKKPYKEKFKATFRKKKKNGKEPVYDLKEPKTHTLVANGMVIHNCGEQPLLPYEACNLGSIKLSNHVKENEDGEAEIDWEKLRETTHKAIRFLDNVIDRSEYPLEKIAEKVKRNRKVGLGVMGFAEMLVKLGVKYDSEEGVKTGRKVMKFINEEAKKASAELAEERGPFPGYETSVYGQDPEEPELRNATRTTIAPTGTISIIANCTGGIEPMFAINYIRNVLDNTRLIETNDLFEKEARQRGIYSQELMAEVAKKGGCQNMDKVPEDMKQKYRTAHDIAPKWHVKMQAAFQDHVNNAVSKTINFPKDASIEDFKEAYKLAYKEGCKGLTVYRYGSLSDQPMNIDEIETDAETAGEYVESKIKEFKTYEEKQKRKTKREKRRNKGKMDPDKLEGAFEVDQQFSPDCPDGTCKI